MYSEDTFINKDFELMLIEKDDEQALSDYYIVKKFCRRIENIYGIVQIFGNTVLDLLTDKIPQTYNIHIENVEDDDLMKIIHEFNEYKSKTLQINIESKTKLYDWLKMQPYSILAISCNIEGGPCSYSPHHDPIEALIKKNLQILNIEAFKNCPHYGLKAISLISRYDLRISDLHTVNIIRDSFDFLKNSRKEIIQSEWNEILLNSNQPSVGLSVAMNLRFFANAYPELHKMNRTKQDPKKHPEGNVWEHTLHVLDAGSKICKKHKLNTEEAKILMYGLLLHDIGKNTTTKKLFDGSIKSQNHEKEGMIPAKCFLNTIGMNPKELTEKIIKIVEFHGIPHELNKDKNDIPILTVENLIKDIHPLSLNLLLLASQADCFGTGMIDKYPIRSKLLDIQKKICDQQ